MTGPTLVSVTDDSQIGEIRRIAARYANHLEFDEVTQGRVGIVSTELATNLRRHATTGRFLIQSVESEGQRRLEMLSLDKGPGMQDVDLALRDGYSTGGTAGNGLGAIRRQSDEFDIYSRPGEGTVVLSRIGPRSSLPELPVVPPRVNPWAAISIPIESETVCGDAWYIRNQDGRFAVMVADGLGHGPLAAEAANKAIASFATHSASTLALQLQEANRALTGTRGAAVAVAQLHEADSVLRYAGIGNIAGSLVTETSSQGLCSHNGTVGGPALRAQEFTYACTSDALLIMHSDGLQTRWNLENYPGLMRRHPAVIAGVLFRDFNRGRDDITVIVARISHLNTQAL